VELRHLYQPIYDLSKDHVIGYEALLRGPEPYGPKDVFAWARRENRLLETDCLSYEIAVSQAPRPGIVFVNLHPATLSWLVQSQGLLRCLGARKPNKVCIEIVEHFSIRDMEAFLAAAKAVRRAGFLIAVDDISSGWDRLHLVAMLTPDYIKIDRKMVADCEQNDAQLIVIRRLVDMARDMRVRVVAEGIETDAELNALRRARVKYGQGKHLAKPGEYASLRPARVPVNPAAGY
jgi:EAL domain-containing protein (putative c-di-GMP-specific phosphodiesterase class I)